MSGARPGRIFLRLRESPGRIELAGMPLRRGDGPLGRLILCARFRGITSRRIVVRRRRRRACPSGLRVLLFGRSGFEWGGEKLFAGNQRGNEERPGQETERARSLFRTLHPGFEDLPLLFDQFAFFYFSHDRRFHDRRLSSRSIEKQLSPGSIRCRARVFCASGMMHRVVVRFRRHVKMPYVEVIRRARLPDGVIERMIGRHRSVRALHVRMIRSVRTEITMGEVELGQHFTRAMIGAALAAVVGRLGVAMVLLRLAVVLVRLAIVLGLLRVIVFAVLRMIVLAAVIAAVVALGLLRVVVVATLVIVIPLGLLAVTAVVGLAVLAWDDSRNLCRLENTGNAAQDRHGFAPGFELATVAGTCLVRITTPSPLLSPDARRWMQRRKINSRLIRAAGAWPRALFGSRP